MNGWWATVPFQDAKPGDEAHVFDYRPIGDEFGWVTDEGYFDDLDDPVTVTRQRWRLVSEDKVMFHPRTELCPDCDGDPDECGTCDGDGRHPAAGSMELLT